MCLAIPGKVIEIKGNNAVVDFDGIQKEINIDLVRSTKVNDYVIVHSGFAIQKLTQEDAWEVLKLHEKSGHHHKKNKQAR